MSAVLKFWKWQDASYWSGKGKYEPTAEKLRALIPAMGEVPNHKQNPKLERFRKYSNAYYDLYNNGGYNRAAEIRRITGFGPKYSFDRCAEMFEMKMDKVIEEAAREQGIQLELTPVASQFEKIDGMDDRD